MERCLLTLALPTALEEQVVDFLLEHPEWAPGFTACRSEGHGQGVKLRGALEEVRGRSRRVEIQVVMSREDAGAMISYLKKRFPVKEIFYWVVPVLDSGRLA